MAAATVDDRHRLEQTAVEMGPELLGDVIDRSSGPAGVGGAQRSRRVVSLGLAALLAASVVSIWR